MKKLLLCLTLFCGLISFSACSCNKDKNDLPTPEVGTSPLARQFGIDKNINVDTLDNYLFRDDVVYRDMRMLKEEVNYEAIGGDSYLSGFVQGFEVVPFPYLAPVEDLPEELTNGYSDFYFIEEQIERLIDDAMEAIYPTVWEWYDSDNDE